MSSQLGSFEKILRVGEGRRMKRLAEQAAYITSIEPEFRELSDDQLRDKTVEFRQRLEKGETLEELLFEAFAAVREARLRESDQRMFDVQLMGGIVLHEGDVAEMKTGEGKTFVASLALYLNALEGKGVHLVTVNDYLAQRDAEWNRGVFERLGMTVSAIENMMPFAERKVAYEADITYGTNSEFGFDRGRGARAPARESLRPAPLAARQPPESGAEGRVAIQARRRLRHPGRRGEDRRRVHGPNHGRAPLVGRAAPGDRGQGRCEHS